MKTHTILLQKSKYSELSILENIRQNAFTPIFDSFRQILGDEIYNRAQKHEDEQQSELLLKMFDKESEWELYSAYYEEECIGFISFRCDEIRKFGEIGLNAIDPKFSGQGFGTQMYSIIHEFMINRGMKVSVVATGGDPSHAAARRAYEKSGYTISIPGVWYCREL